MFNKDEEDKKMNRHSLNGCKTSKNGGRIALAVALAGLIACPALARTVTVASCDHETGATTLAISAAAAGDGAKALFAAWSQVDFNDIVNASETEYVGVVAAAETEKAFTIPAAWREKFGFVRFYLMADVPPYDARLASIRSASAGPYIDTGFVPDTSSDIRVKTYYPNSNVVPFGIKLRVYLFSNEYSSNTTALHYFNFFGETGTTVNGSVSAPRGTVPHEYKINAEGVYIDETRYKAFNSSDFSRSTTNSLTLFARKVDGETVESGGDCTIYWAQLRQNGVLVHDYVPCRANGVATLYDRTKGTFCTVKGSGSFTAGAEIGPDAGDCGGVESATDALVFANATWDGGGADTSFATAANWDGDALPDLTSGAMMLTFASSGSAAQVPSSGAFAGSIRFDTADNFALTAASDGTLSLGAGGITLANRAVANDTTWRYHDLNLPVVLVADQTWNMSTVAKQRLRVQGNLQGAAARTLTITGSGCLSLYATNDFAGNVVLNGGVIKTFSQVRPFGSATGGGKIVIDQSKGAQLEMWACVIDKPIRVTSSSSGNGNKFKAYGTCAITEKIYQISTNRFIIAQDSANATGYEHSTLTLGGGGEFNGPVWFFPQTTTPRKLVIEGAPIVQSTLGDRDKAFKFYGKTEVHLKNQGNQMYIELGAAQEGTGSSLHFWTNNVLDYRCDIILGYSSTLDLHGFDQQVGDLMTGGGGRIRSDEPATILAYYDVAGGKTWGDNAGLDGAVTFKKSGPQTLTINGGNTTTGALIAQNGPLVMGTTGSWQGTDVRIGATNSNRHASLRLTRSNGFTNPRNTILTMTTSTTASTFYTDCGSSREPELKLDAGVNAVFKDVILNGHRLAPGTWGGTSSSAQHKDATHFSGSGMITVIGSGAMIIFR